MVGKRFTFVFILSLALVVLSWPVIQQAQALLMFIFGRRGRRKKGPGED